MNNRKTAIVAAMAAMATTVMAQDKDAASDSVMVMEEVIVTANKLEEKLQDVPQSVTLITGEAIQEKGIRNIADLVREIPNLSSNFIYSNQINFRGINTSIFTNTNPVVIYVDGVPQSNRISYDALLENVERVEVLRGPQGTLYGKDSIGGVINIITKTPTNDFSGHAGAEVANQDGREATFSLNGPAIKDRLFFSLSGKIARNDGWITNSFPGMNEDADRADEQRFKLGLLYTISPDTQVRINASRDDQTNYWIQGGAAPFGVDYTSFSRDDASKARFDEKTYTETVADAQSLTLQHRFGWATLDAILTNKSVELDGIYDVDFGADPRVRGLTQFQFQTIDTRTQEVRLSGGEAGETRWVGGLYFEQEKIRNTRYGFQALGANLGSPFGPGVNVDFDAPSTTESNIQALFGQVMIPLGQSLELTVGGRYQRIEKDFDGEFYFQPVGTTGFPPAFSLDGNNTWSAFLPKVALSYDITPQWTSYVSIAKGYLPGGYNYFPSSSVEAENRFDPQTSINYEIGVRSDFGRLYLSAALFYMDIKDIHVYSFDASTGLITTSNAGKARSQGIELEVNYLLDEQWMLSGAFGLVDAQYDDYPNRALNGNDIENTPSYTATIGLQYTANNGFYGRADVRGQGRRYFNAENTLEDDAYFTLDLKTGYKTGPWDFYAYVRNITDEEYLTTASPGADGGSLLIFGEPRRFGLGARYSF